jgi:hypothetical protein
MSFLGRSIGLLIALPFVPLAYAVALLRTVAAGRQAVQTSAPDAAGLALQALGIVQRERESRGLEPLDCARIEISYGDFDGMHIQFGPQTLADGAAEGMQRMGELANFDLMPKISNTMALAQARARVQALKSGMRD